ncbi:MAG: efflux RND transporter permease subunit [Clostridiales bacterium]|nr:efflux RND transporter permease subunit [Clostridiales bacterium]
MKKKKDNLSELHQKKNILGKISGLFIDRYRTVYLILLAVFIAGWMSYTDLPRENMPEVESNIITVTTPYIGASPEDVEKLITNPMEKAMTSLDNLTNCSSVSASGYSMITLEFDYGISMEDTMEEVRSAVKKVNLPDDVTEPEVWHMKTTEIPILIMSITGSSDLASISAVADDLKSNFEAVDGIDSIEVSGGTESIVSIVVKPARLEASGITINDIIQAINGSNVAMPIGKTAVDGQEFNVRLDEEFNSIEEIKNVNIRSSVGTMQVRDVASVKVIDDEGDSISRTYRREQGTGTTPVVYMEIYRENGADTIGPVDEILNMIENDIGTLYPEDVEIIITSNFAEEVEKSLGNVMDSAFSGLMVVVLVLFLFIDLREALIVSLIIPLSMLVSCIVMKQVGITLNSVSLMGFVIALGLLVDNAIVVIENIDRIRDYGVGRKLAAKVAINQVAPAVLAATLTTVSAFIPLAMTGGMLGLMLRSLPMTIIFAISASFLISLIITPTIASRALKKYKGKEENVRGKMQFYKKVIAVVSVGVLALFAFRIEGEFSGFSYVGALIFAVAMYVKQFKMKKAHGEGKHIEVYSKWLSGILQSAGKKVAIIVIAVVMLIGSIILIPLGVIQMELMPNEEPDSMKVEVELPKGYQISDTTEIVSEIEERLYQFDDIDSFTSTIGGRNSNEANIEIELVDKDIRAIDGYDMIGEVRTVLESISGAEIKVNAVLNIGSGPGSGDPITINLSGGSYKKMSELADQYYDVLTGIEGVEDASISSRDGIPELIVDIDPELAYENGVVISNMAMELRSAVNGINTSTYQFEDKEINIRIGMSEDRFDNVKDIENMTFTSVRDTKVPFSDVATLHVEKGVSQIVHDDGQINITIGGFNEPDANINEIVKSFKENIEDITVPDGITVSYGGEFDMMEDTFSDMTRNLIFALLLVYIILSVQFNSLTQPMVIIMSVPLALIGTFVGLALTGNNLGFYSLFGIVSLVGIAVNDAIILVDYINYLRKESYSKNEAIVKAVKTRFSPVFATSITTIGGVLPISIADPALGQLGFTLIFGLMASTVLTLLIIPIVYSLNDTLTEKLSTKFALFEEESEEVLLEM